MKAILSGIMAVAVLSFSACAAGKQKKNAASAQNTEAVLTQKWMIKEMRGATPEKLVKAGAHITFNKDMNGSAYLGCNGVSFQYKEAKGNALSFSGVLSTMMYCDEFSPMESIFTNEIVKGYTYEIKGHFLYLKDSKGVFIKAIRPDWD